MSEAAPLWTAEQQRWLAALGHTVWMHGTLPEPSPTMVAEAAVAPAPLPPARREFQKAPQQPKASPRLPETDSAPVVAPARRPATALPDRLHFALIRAAKINPGAPGMAEVIAGLPASSELRGDPAAKRALWPRLRALRRNAR